jgi:UDP-N-acetylmuramate--alanine ligase
MIGIAGSGMQALAEVLLGRGWQLSGSDANPASAQWLRDSGVRLYAGHDSGHVRAGNRLVIYSGAVPASNDERSEAARLGLAQRSYSQVVADLMAQRRGMAVAGTHGKSTTTAMIAEILTGGGFDPTVICGAGAVAGGCGGRAGEGEWLVAEACEYQANFLRLRPEIALVLNIEPDHFDFYTSRAHLEATFQQFVRHTADNGIVVASADCPATRRALAATRTRAITFGFTADADWRATRIEQSRGLHQFDIEHNGRVVCRAKLPVPGRHQVANALAAAAASHAAGATAEDIARGLASLAGLRRRMEHVASADGIDFWDDYAHHPTEVRAALAAVRLIHPGRRLWCIFQPHQISRTGALLDEFAASLHNADRVAVSEVFVARERASVDPLMMAEKLRQRVQGLGSVVLPDCRAATILDNIAAAVRPGDVVITLGAGDIRNRLYELVDRL